jgi:hypothetical protein
LQTWNGFDLGTIGRRDRARENQFCVEVARDVAILRLGKRYDEVRLEAACKRALQVSARSYRHVESILKNGLDRVATTQDATTISRTRMCAGPTTTTP